MQTTQWVDIDLSFHAEALQVGHEHVEASKYRGNPLCIFSAFHDGLQLPLGFLESI